MPAPHMLSLALGVELMFSELHPEYAWTVEFADGDAGDRDTSRAPDEDTESEDRCV